jgi:hypothetical protein
VGRGEGEWQQKRRNGMKGERIDHEMGSMQSFLILPLTTNTYLYMDVFKHILVSRYIHIKTCITVLVVGGSKTNVGALHARTRVKSSKDISGGFAFVFFHVARADELIF